MEYLLHIGTLLCIYLILVLSANLTVGMANLLTLCQAAFYGIGAYIGTFFLMHFNLPFVVVALLVMLATGVTSFIISYASIKLKEDYFVLATLGFQAIVFAVLYNWDNVTQGSSGIWGIPHIKLFGFWELKEDYMFFLFALVIAAMVCWVFRRLQRSPYGRILKAIRTDEIAVKALGRNTVKLKTWAFFISAAFTSVAGLVFAAFIGAIDPTSFTIDESIFILTALFIGGAGSRIRGPLAGALLMVVLPELLRFVGLPQGAAANLRQMIYGLLLIVLVFIRPQGLLGDSKLS